MQASLKRELLTLRLTMAVLMCFFVPITTLAQVQGQCQVDQKSLVKLLFHLSEQSEDVKNGELFLKVAQEKLQQSKNDRKPTLDFTLQANAVSDNSITSSFSDNFRATGNQQLEFSQPLWTGGRISAAIGFAEQNRNLERSRLDAIKSQVLLLGAEQLRSLELTRQRLEIRKELVNSLETQVTLVETRFELGQLTKTDLARARAQLIDARRSVVQETYAMREVELRIQALFNISMSGLKLEFSYPVEVISRGEANNIAMSQNTELAVLNEQIELAKRQIAVERKSLSPRIDLNVIGGARQDEFFGNSEDLSVVGTLRIPIYDKGHRRSRTRIAKLNLQQVRLSRDQRIREVRARVSALMNSIDEAKVSLELANQVVGFATSAYEAALEEQRLQRRSSFEVLALEQSLLSARVAQIDANLDRVITKVRLDAELGRLQAVVNESVKLCFD